MSGNRAGVRGLLSRDLTGYLGLVARVLIAASVALAEGCKNAAQTGCKRGQLVCGGGMEYFQVDGLVAVNYPVP